jgi:hypothetical protein
MLSVGDPEVKYVRASTLTLSNEITPFGPAICTAEIKS